MRRAGSPRSLPGSRLTQPAGNCFKSLDWCKLGVQNGPVLGREFVYVHDKS